MIVAPGFAAAFGGLPFPTGTRCQEPSGLCCHAALPPPGVGTVEGGLSVAAFAGFGPVIGFATQLPFGS